MQKQFVRDSSGRFDASGPERKGKMIGFRLPLSLENHLRQVAGDDIRGWIEQAVREKLARS